MKKTRKNSRTASRAASKGLSHLRASAASSSVEPGGGPEPVQAGMEEYDPEKPARTAGPEAAVPTIVRAAFEAAVSEDVRTLLTNGKSLAVVVVVPTPAWVAPVEAYVKSAFGSRWCMKTREGLDRKQNASTGSGEVARELSVGCCVMGIAADAALLPAALTAAADVTIRVAAPDGAVLRRAITRFARSSPGRLPAGIAAGLDLYEMVAAFRPGTGARDIVRRLEAAGRSGLGPVDRVPLLETAVEYGPARLWGLDLARDIAAFRAGTIRSWKEIDRGVCIHSAPGMGKSLFARVLAKACGVPLVSTSVGAWFADGPGNLDSVIKQQRAAYSRAAALASPCCLLFLDEIDALPDRETLSDRNRDWWTPIIADALLLLDSSLDRTGIVAIGATNLIGRVDKALLRPGRLEKIIEIPPPDAAGAVNILRFHLDADLRGDDLTGIGALFDGSTGAEIMHAVRLARRAARNAGRPVAVDDLRRAALPAEDVPPAHLFRMAVHESAHAVAALAIKPGTVRRVVLRRSGASGGQTVTDFGDDGVSTRVGIEDRVVVGLAARAAERIFTGAVSTASGGAPHSDIGAATAMIASIHASYGMGEDLVYLAGGDDLLFRVALDHELRERVASHLRELEHRAEKLVEANRDAVLAVARRLAEKRFLDGAEVADIVRGLLAAPDAADRRPEKENPC
ncbi:MAG: cell division protease FtsH [Bradyrhizobium sp.]|nr:cell division protease FtsH [Bradyrhizobium sp.]